MSSRRDFLRRMALAGVGVVAASAGGVDLLEQILEPRRKYFPGWSPQRCTDIPHLWRKVQGNLAEGFEYKTEEWLTFVDGPSASVGRIVAVHPSAITIEWSEQQYPNRWIVGANR